MSINRKLGIWSRERYEGLNEPEQRPIYHMNELLILVLSISRADCGGVSS